MHTKSIMCNFAKKLENNSITNKLKLKVMKVYDYYKDGKIYATFTENHEKERRHFESLQICVVCKVTNF